MVLANDNTTVNYLNQRLLTRPGVAGQVVVAENGAACPNLLDMSMPVRSGLAFLQAYVQMSLAQQLVIIVRTASLHAHFLARAQQLPLPAFPTSP